MRLFAIPLLSLAFVAAPAFADDEKETLCRERADLVVEAFNARKAGERRGKVQREMRAVLDRTAAEMLTEFVFSVPDEALTEEQISGAGDMFYEQCKAL